MGSLRSLRRSSAEECAEIQEQGIHELIDAICKKDYGTFLRLIEKVKNLNAWSETQETTPLNAACWSNDAQCVKMLLKKGASVNVRSRTTGQTPLMEVMSDNHSRVGARIAKMLLDSGSKVNAVDKWGFTALMLAAHIGSLKSVQLLLDAGADPTIPNKRGEKAYDHAPMRKIRELLKVTQ